MNSLQLLFVKLIKAGNYATPASAKLYQTAMSFLGKDASPKNLAPNEVACAESVNDVVFAAFLENVGGGLSTASMYQALQSNTKFAEVSSPLKGDIVISPTGTGNGQLSNGHVGIVGDNNQIMSNNSENGIWDIHYTVASWRARYVSFGAMPMKYYRRMFM
jgi:Bacteriophage peptidoglycan hydrolase